MRALRIALLTLLFGGLMSATAFGSGYIVRSWEAVVDATEAATAADPRTSRTPAEPVREPREVAAPPTLAPPPNILEPGDKGEKVRELQYRLHELAWWPELTTGTYGKDTKAAVAGFQAKRRGLKSTGVVDPETWHRLLKMTRTPTHDQKFNVLHPGPALLASGAEGDDVRDLQARLKQIAWLFGDVTGTYDAETVEAVRGFQAKRQIPVTGEVDWRTQERLHLMTSAPSHEAKYNIKPKPGALAPECRTGRALCVDKSRNNLRWVVDGKVITTVDVRFGSDELPTREGLFHVQRKSRDHVSSLYDTSMPFAMFFSGGQAVHYSPDFAANGYSGASHGCVNVRDYDTIAWLFDEVRLGDKVVVYWS